MSMNRLTLAARYDDYLAVAEFVPDGTIIKWKLVANRSSIEKLPELENGFNFYTLLVVSLKEPENPEDTLHCLVLHIEDMSEELGETVKNITEIPGFNKVAETFMASFMEANGFMPDSDEKLH